MKKKKIVILIATFLSILISAFPVRAADSDGYMQVFIYLECLSTECRSSYNILEKGVISIFDYSANSDDSYTQQTTTFSNSWGQTYFVKYVKRNRDAVVVWQAQQYLENQGYIPNIISIQKKWVSTASASSGSSGDPMQSPGGYERKDIKVCSLAVFADKFPLDIIVGISEGEPGSECPALEIFGERVEACYLMQIFTLLEIPALIWLIIQVLINV